MTMVALTSLRFQNWKALRRCSRIGANLFQLFVGVWIYSIAASGFIVGVPLGWLPSAIAAGIVW
jgi:hypothetical protein